jgi:surface polysaccharide O-acyltransferase-like enzyme
VHLSYCKRERGIPRENFAKPADANFSVDLIRTVAIILVVLVHATGFPYHIPGEITPTVIWNWWTIDVYGAVAYLAVPLFIMLSGALLLDPARADESMKVFFKKRFARIGLPMIFWTIAISHGGSMFADNRLL